MCKACGNLCCSSDEDEGCGCEHCFDPACMPSVCKRCASPDCPATDGIASCIGQTPETYNMEEEFVESGL